VKFALSIAGQIGTAFGEDFSRGGDNSPRFCVGLDLSQEWISAVTAYSPSGGSAVITINYDGVQIRCPLYRDHGHTLASCAQNNPNRNQSSPRSSALRSPLQARERSRERSQALCRVPLARTRTALALPRPHPARARRPPRRPQRHYLPRRSPESDADGFIPVITCRRHSQWDVQPLRVPRHNWPNHHHRNQESP
jgi:hypothetical protein